jgi:uncharacterized membrane protein YhaH (DUF805 family)
MLGYRGRSNRRDFIGGCALLVVGPLAIGAAIDPLVQWAQARGQGLVYAAAAFALLLFAAVFLAAWLWGFSVLLTRRARDIGWPAWIGATAAAVAGVAAFFFGGPFFFALIGMMAGLPARRERTDAESRANVFG